MEVRVLALTNNHYIISQVDEVATEEAEKEVLKRIPEIKEVLE